MLLQKVSLQLSCPLLKIVITIFQHKSSFPLLEFKIQLSPPGKINKQIKWKSTAFPVWESYTERACTHYRIHSTLSKTFLTLEAHVLLFINKGISTNKKSWIYKITTALDKATV